MLVNVSFEMFLCLVMSSRIVAFLRLSVGSRI